MKRLSHVLAALRSATMSLGTKTVKRVVPEIAAGLSKEGAMKLARLGAIFATAILVFGTPLMLKATSPDVIYYIDSNQNVDELRFNGSNWSTTNVTSATSATKASSTGGITGHLFGSSDNVWYIGKDQHVHELAYYGAPASWHTSDITSLAGATNANLNSPLTSHAFGSSDNVFYIATDGDIHELAFYGSPATWHTTNITTNSGAPAPASSSPLTGEDNTVDNTESTFFIASDSHVHQISFNGNTSTWGTADLTYDTSGTDAASGSKLTSHMYGNSENVFYQGTDGDLHEFAYYGSPAAWHTSNVTGASGSSAPISGSALAGNQNGNYDDVYFIASGPLVFLNWFNPSGDVWSATNVTGSAGATAPASSTAINSHMWQNTTPEVFDFLSNAHVQELAFYSNAWHGSDLTSTTSAPLAESGSPIVGFTGI